LSGETSSVGGGKPEERRKIGKGEGTFLAPRIKPLQAEIREIKKLLRRKRLLLRERAPHLRRENGFVPGKNVQRARLTPNRAIIKNPEARGL